jgi:hypothetical protein
MPGDFNTFSLYNQFVHVKPVLSAILHGKYAPVQDNHRRWMRGGKLRADVIRENANIRGRMQEQQLIDLKNLIFEWALGRKTSFDGDDNCPQESAGETHGIVYEHRNDSKVITIPNINTSNQTSNETYCMVSYFLKLFDTLQACV